MWQGFIGMIRRVSERLGIREEFADCVFEVAVGGVEIADGGLAAGCEGQRTVVAYVARAVYSAPRPFAAIEDREFEVALENCCWREAPEPAVGQDRRAGERGLAVLPVGGGIGGRDWRRIGGPGLCPGPPWKNWRWCRYGEGCLKPDGDARRASRCRDQTGGPNQVRGRSQLLQLPKGLRRDLRHLRNSTWDLCPWKVSARRTE
jgi:hypothetical protein